MELSFKSAQTRWKSEQRELSDSRDVKHDYDHSVFLPNNSKCAITDGSVWLHLCGARHLAGWVAVGLRHRRAAAGASSKGCGVTRGPCRGGGSGEARCGAEARGGGSAGGAHAEILVAQLRARK